MPQAAIRAYWDRLPARHAELRLLLAPVISLPYVPSDGERSRLLEQWAETASGPRAVRVASRGALAMMGIAVVDVPLKANKVN